MKAPDNLQLPSTASIGLSAELLVASQFAAVGGIPSFPLHPCRYDLIVDFEGDLHRVQTKRARWAARSGRDRPGWQARLNKRARIAGAPMKPYAVSDFDYLALVCRVDCIYLLPVHLLRSPENELFVISQINLKPLEGAGHRDDAWAAAARWEPYRNHFDLRVPVGEPPARIVSAPPQPSKAGRPRAVPDFDVD